MADSRHRTTDGLDPDLLASIEAAARPTRAGTSESTRSFDTDGQSVDAQFALPTRADVPGLSSPRRATTTPHGARTVGGVGVPLYVDVDASIVTSLMEFGDGYVAPTEPPGAPGRYGYVREPSVCAFDASIPSRSSVAVAYWDSRSGLGRLCRNESGRTENTALLDPLGPRIPPQEFVPPLPVGFLNWAGQPTLLANHRGQVVLVGLAQLNDAGGDARRRVAVALSNDGGRYFDTLRLIDEDPWLGLPGSTMPRPDASVTHDMPHAVLLGHDTIWVVWAARRPGEVGASDLFIRGMQIRDVDAIGNVGAVLAFTTAVLRVPNAATGFLWWPRIQARWVDPRDVVLPGVAGDSIERSVLPAALASPSVEISVVHTEVDPTDPAGIGALHAWYVSYRLETGFGSPSRITPSAGLPFPGGVFVGTVRRADGRLDYQPLVMNPPRAAFVWNEASGEPWVAVPTGSRVATYFRTSQIVLFRRDTSHPPAGWYQADVIAVDAFTAGGYAYPDMAYDPESGIVALVCYRGIDAQAGVPPAEPVLPTIVPTTFAWGRPLAVERFSGSFVAVGGYTRSSPVELPGFLPSNRDGLSEPSLDPANALARNALRHYISISRVVTSRSTSNLGGLQPAGSASLTQHAGYVAAHARGRTCCPVCLCVERGWQQLRRNAAAEHDSSATASGDAGLIHPEECDQPGVNRPPFAHAALRGDDANNRFGVGHDAGTHRRRLGDEHKATARRDDPSRAPPCHRLHDRSPPRRRILRATHPSLACHLHRTVFNAPPGHHPSPPRPDAADPDPCFTRPMRAVVITEHGGPEVLEIRDVATPTPGPGQIRVKVAASALNRADVLQRMGFYPAPDEAPPDIPGLEFAGTVDTVGDGVSAPRVGERVYGIVGGGGHAEYVIAHARAVAPVPPELDDVSAAAVPEAFMTAHDALVSLGRLTPGSRVLVHAVGSGVGIAAVQIAAAWHARVWGTARTRDKLTKAEALGLHHAITDNDFADAVLRDTHGDGMDVIVDFVGAAYLDGNVRALASRGRLILVGMLGGTRGEIDLAAVLRKRAEVIGTVLRSRPLEEKIVATQRFAREVGPLLARGILKPVLDVVLPFDRVREAHERMAANLNFGKIVLRW